MEVTVLTMARGRHAALARLLEGLAAGDTPPARAVLVEMDEVPRALPATPFPLELRHRPGGGLPLAAARNLAARGAATEGLVFLDADCIPAPDMLRVLAADLAAHDALVCPEVLYLPPGAVDEGVEAGRLAALGRPHPHRPFPPGRLAPEPRTGLFWSLAFAIRRTSFAALGGFDEGYEGYGAEDTDLAFRAAACGLPLLLEGRTRAFHQYHPVYDPPLPHFAAILANARRFRARHGFWPMDGWLRDFAARGLVEWREEGEELRLLRGPTPEEVEAARLPEDRLV